MCSSRDTSREVVFTSINRPLQVFTLKETVSVTLRAKMLMSGLKWYNSNFYLIKNVEESVVFLTRKVYKINSLNKQILIYA